MAAHVDVSRAREPVYDLSMFEIQPFASEHQTGVVSVILTIQREEFELPITLEAQPDLLDIPGYYRKGAGNFWVALSRDEVVGTISLLDIGHGQGALRKMFVRRDHRGGAAGVAKQLLDHLLRWCVEKSLQEIYLGTTPKFLAAHRFYEKNAFDEIAKSDLPPTFPIMVVDTKFYRRRLSAGASSKP